MSQFQAILNSPLGGHDHTTRHNIHKVSKLEENTFNLEKNKSIEREKQIGKCKLFRCIAIACGD